MVKDLKLHAYFDEQAGVWVAESEQVPGLATEANTLEALFTKLSGLVPELLSLNLDELSQAELDSPATELGQQLEVLEADLPRDELGAWFAAFENAPEVSR
jgi:predicted RNase H-like HicB family nuclease